MVLVLVFSRDDSDSEPITAFTWANKRKQNLSSSKSSSSSKERDGGGGEPFHLLPFLPKTQQLYTIWTDQSACPPVEIIKGGETTYNNIRQQFLLYNSEIDLTKGIVLCAGGYHYFTSAYMLVRQLRHHGCTLPIEMWYKDQELSADHVEYMKRFGCVCLNVTQLAPFQIQHKFSLKVLSMYFSSFQELMFLDADNNVLADPTYLFDSPAYQTTGALFWPDFWVLNGRSAPCYQQFPYTKEQQQQQQQPKPNYFQQESGQLVVNKEKYWRQIWCVFRILEHNLEHLFPAPYNFGDKDLFHVTFDACQCPYTFVQHRVKAIAVSFVNIQKKQVRTVAMGQSDVQGNLLFIHQNSAEWGDRPSQVAVQGHWWNIVKEHTHPTQGSVEPGLWNPTGPTRVYSFRKRHGHVEDDYVPFLKELRQESWYQSFYLRELERRAINIIN